MNRISLLITLLFAFPLGMLLSACGGGAPAAPPPAGAGADLPTFRYFYTDN